MKLLLGTAALFALVGALQVAGNMPFGSQSRSAATEMVDYLRSPTALRDLEEAAQPRIHYPAARYQKLFWVPAYDYRDRPIWT